MSAFVIKNNDTTLVDFFDYSLMKKLASRDPIKLLCIYNRRFVKEILVNAVTVTLRTTPSK